MQDRFELALWHAPAPIFLQLQDYAGRVYMRMLLTIVAAVLSIGISESRAQVPLTAYVDANGYIDVQKLTCAQLADTYQPDADALMAWYSGWYNGLAHKHFMDYRKGKFVEHEVIVFLQGTS